MGPNKLLTSTILPENETARRRWKHTPNNLQRTRYRHRPKNRESHLCHETDGRFTCSTNAHLDSFRLALISSRPLPINIPLPMTVLLAQQLTFRRFHKHESRRAHHPEERIVEQILALPSDMQARDPATRCVCARDLRASTVQMLRNSSAVSGSRADSAAGTTSAAGGRSTAPVPHR